MMTHTFRAARLALVLGGLAFFGAACVRADAPAQAVYDFTALNDAGMSVDGGCPSAPLLQAANGGWIGTTFEGGALGGGTLFALSADGSVLTTLHSLDPVAEGGTPSGALTQGADGTLYGTAGSGGAGSSGSVWACHADGTGFQVLHAFAGSDGGGPEAGVLLLPDGFLYGTTTDGGAHGQGAVFKIKTDGTGFALLHSFGGSDGSAPTGGLALGNDGRLYGTTFGGGPSGSGTIFQIATDGTGFATLHAFSGPDGADPNAGVTALADGFLYGTTSADSVNGAGTVFKVKADGSGFQSLYVFGGLDGADPLAPLTPAPDGSLGGTTFGGGAEGAGAAFSIRPDGTGFQVLASLSGSGDEGGGPNAALTWGSDGAWHGTTFQGGSNGAGAIFQIAPPATPPAHAHLLWNGPGGAASLWTVDGSGSVTMLTYGPFDGWTARAAATGPDGVTHLLWTQAGGEASVWTLDAAGNVAHAEYGPFAGWNVAPAFSAGPDGQMHLLWNRTTDNLASLWSVDPDTGNFTESEDGPYSDWAVQSVAVGPDNQAHLLWDGTGGMGSLWTAASSAGDAFAPFVYGPFANWTAAALAVGSDTLARPLWTAANGAACLWTVQTNGNYAAAVYGPFAGWQALGNASGPDGLTRLLWSRPADGAASLWAVQPSGAFTAALYGPYPGWNAVAVSAGP